MPEDVTAADLDALVARWGQSVRYAVADGTDRVRVGAARGVVVNASIANVAEILTAAVNA